MKKLMLLSIFLISISLCYGQAAKLDSLAAHIGMIFKKPKDWQDVPIIKNTQMNYDYAIKPKDKTFEIRYSISPLDSALIRYKTWQANKKPGSMMTNPNSLYPATFLAIAANISGGKIPEKVLNYPADAIKGDFGADQGCAALLQVTGEFANDYKYCFLICLHKTDQGLAYIFYMTNTQADLSTYLPLTATLLKYR